MYCFTTCGIKVVVIERNGFPSGHLFPAPRMPANKLCVVDLYDLDENMVMQNKKCVLNYHAISDPWDVDNNGVSVISNYFHSLPKYLNFAYTSVLNFPFILSHRLTFMHKLKSQTNK